MWDDSQLSSSNSERKKKESPVAPSVPVSQARYKCAGADDVHRGGSSRSIIQRRFLSHNLPILKPLRPPFPPPPLADYSCMWRAKNMRHAQAALVSSHAPSALVTVVSHPPPRANEQLCIASLFWFFLLALVVRSHHSCLVCVGGTFFAAHVCMCTTCLRGWLCGPLFKISPPCWSTKRVEGDGDSWLLRRWGRVRTGILLADLQ